MYKNVLLIWFVFSLVIFNRAFSQTSVEQKLDRIEAKLDTVLKIIKIQKTTTIYETIKDNQHLLYGVASIKGTLLNKSYFIINHNNEWKIPYWVAYHVSSSLLQGDAARTDDFRSDPELPAGSRAELEDYRNSGYDRGHNAPAADFKRTREAMSKTFLLSNMSPQTPKLNRNIWEKLESQVRQMVTEKGEAWIITGNVFMSQDSHFVVPAEFIGTNRVAVPTHCFKVIMLSQENGRFIMYAFLIPNARDNIPGVPSDYVVRVDRLEEITGYDFFPELNDSIENEIESVMPAGWPR